MGQPERGARLLGAAAGLLDAIGAAWQPVERVAVDQYEAGARAQLDEEALAAAWAASRALTLAQAVAEAMAEQTAEIRS